MDEDEPPARRGEEDEAWLLEAVGGEAARSSFEEEAVGEDAVSLSGAMDNHPPTKPRLGRDVAVPTIVE